MAGTQPSSSCTSRSDFPPDEMLATASFYAHGLDHGFLLPCICSLRGPCPCAPLTSSIPIVAASHCLLGASTHATRRLGAARRCGMLVMLMTPALGLFYGGMVSTANVRERRPGAFGILLLFSLSSSSCQQLVLLRAQPTMIFALPHAHAPPQNMPAARL